MFTVEWFVSHASSAIVWMIVCHEVSQTREVRQRVKDIQNWRLDFEERHVLERFLEYLNLALELWRCDVKDGPAELRGKKLVPF